MYNVALKKFYSYELYPLTKTPSLKIHQKTTLRLKADNCSTKCGTLFTGFLIVD